MTDMNKILAEAKKEAQASDLKTAWQTHRALCVRLAVDTGCGTASDAIREAEKFSDYILNGKPNA